MTFLKNYLKKHKVSPIALWKHITTVLFLISFFFIPPFLVGLISASNWQMLVFMMVVTSSSFLCAFFYMLFWHIRNNNGLKIAHTLGLVGIGFIAVCIWGQCIVLGIRDIKDGKHVYQGECYVKRTHSLRLDSYSLLTYEKNEIQIKGADYYLLRGNSTVQAYPYTCQTPIRMVYLQHLGIALDITPLPIENQQ